MLNSIIILNTRGRNGCQITLNNLIDSIKNEIVIVCNNEDFNELKYLYCRIVKDIVIHPDWCNNLSLIRFWCLCEFNKDNIIFIDDNLEFCVRKKSELSVSNKFPLHNLINLHFTKETIELTQINMFNFIEEKLNLGYGMAGISQRSGNNNVEELYLENTRIFAFYGINTKLFNKYVLENCYIENYPIKQDFYFNLLFLTNGIKTICSYEFAFNKKSVNGKGGCSLYRNEKMLNNIAIQLKNDFPDFVNIRKKKSKSWDNLGDYITDVTVFWKKAYEYGIKNNLK